MIYNVNCLDYLRECRKYHTIFADPPDNIGLKYGKHCDNRPLVDYYNDLELMMRLAIDRSKVFWLSYYWRHDLELKYRLRTLVPPSKSVKTFIWRFTFGQYNDRDCGSGFRFLVRIASLDWKPDVSGIRIPSERQLMGDKRACGPRVPDDVWEYDVSGVWAYPRVVGNSPERREWHPTQHPETLIERIVRLSGCKDVLDLYAGTGTVDRVCTQLKVPCDSLEIDPNYVSIMKRR